MYIKIDETIIQICVTGIKNYLEEHTNLKKESFQNQAFSVDILNLLSFQILIPFFVSLTSCAVYDVLKGKVLAQMGLKKSKKILKKFNRRKLDSKAPLSEECMNMVLTELSPLGLDNEDIEQIFIQIKTTLVNQKKFITNEEIGSQKSEKRKKKLN